jgi:hypothetical protein
MLAKLTSRTPVNYTPPATVPDTVPWAIPYVPGATIPNLAHLPQGVYTLAGQSSGSATVQITVDPAENVITKVQVSYVNYSDDGVTKLNGQESTANTSLQLLTQYILWTSSLTQTGYSASSVIGNGTLTYFVNRKTTSPGGLNVVLSLVNPIFEATGTLSSLVNGVLYTQPGNGD